MLEIQNNPRFERLRDIPYNSFDWALPQDWVDDVYNKTGTYPAGLFVWSYAKAKVWGEPFPLNEEADNLLEKYNANGS